ncbi:unnamed protein product [Spirodela intermedia]|uniref:superoxide dismutase n=1 Tax=Spirodela intermedia TaxID=51605 RepID=A0A7I8JUI2_SPIIN|nr:unnamed protein product [Spirodela intermedia]CAA6673848.1 unnamed protein product [Spirodela intermedia]
MHLSAVATDAEGYIFLKLTYECKLSKIRIKFRKACEKQKKKKKRIRKMVGRCRTRITAQLELKAPPYSLDALEPYMSRETLEYHWGKHHRGYVDNLNKQISGTDLDGLALEEIVVRSYNRGNPLPPSTMLPRSIWNHDFFWSSMKPGGGGQPRGVLLELIERDFGSLEGLLNEFKQAALTQFEKDNKLVVQKSPNAVNPLVWDYHPLLVVDVWEHAYYVDYQNRRPEFVSTFIEKLISWDAVSARLEEAIAQAAARAEEDERRREEEDGVMDDGDAIEMYLDTENESEAE